MKRKCISMLLLCLLICLSGCEKYTKVKEYTLDGKAVQFQLPNAWDTVEVLDSSLELSRSYADLKASIYHPSELDGITPKDLLEEKIKEEMKDKKDARLVEEYPVSSTRDRKIYSVLYSAEKDGKEEQYYMNMMHFLGTDTYVYVVYVATSYYMRYNMDDINRVLLRMEWNGEERDLAFE